MIPWYALESLPSKRSNPLLNARNARLDAEVIALPNQKRPNHSRPISWPSTTAAFDPLFVSFNRSFPHLFRIISCRQQPILE
jgi:hypothetical protein